MKTKIKEQIDLSGFTGTEQYYRSTFGKLKLTDGVHYLRTKGNCFWLIDIIESYQNKLKNQEFQVWKLRLNENSEADVYCEDGNDKCLIHQELQYTDFKEQTGLVYIELWVENGVVMLPSER